MAKEESPEIQEAERRLEELRAKRDGKYVQEYPKMISAPGDPTSRLVVNSKEEEAAHRGEVVKAFDLSIEEQAAETAAKAEADKEAAKGKSRLAGSQASAKAEKPGLFTQAKQGVAVAKAKVTRKGK